MLERRLVEFLAIALIEDGLIPFKPERIERLDDRVCTARNLARRVDILDPYQPCAPSRARAQVAADRRYEGTEVKWAGR